MAEYLVLDFHQTKKEPYSSQSSAVSRSPAMAQRKSSKQSPSRLRSCCTHSLLSVWTFAPWTASRLRSTPGRPRPNYRICRMGPFPPEMSDQPETMGLGRTVAVRRGEEYRFHIVLRAALGLMALSSDPQEQNLACGCIESRSGSRRKRRASLQDFSEAVRSEAPLRRAIPADIQ